MDACPRCGAETPDGARFCASCGMELAQAAPAPERRGLATVLFCDLTGSTELGERLDPEATRNLMATYFRRMRGAIERHGGTVEKFIGDAVMAVFGFPVTHEDDALRALRAAGEMQGAVAELNADLEPRFGLAIAIRIGVEAGEVVGGTGSEHETIVTGDPVNVAARLEQSAEPGQVLVGPTAARLADAGASLTGVGALELKGKAAPLEAFLLGGVPAEGRPGPAPRTASLIGRARELELLRRAHAESVDRPAPKLALVVGEPGVGKSRLVEELLADLPGEPRVLRARALSYGAGITYWPLAELVREVLGTPGEAIASVLSARVGSLLADDDHRDAVASVLAAAIGADEAASSTGEISWAARRFLGALARERPLVVVLDDLHWAEAAFLDLVHDLVSLSEPVPLFVLGLARPELLERHDWPAVRLEPLAGEEAERHVDVLIRGRRLDEAARRRVLDAAGGNPLFAEELVAMLEADPTAALPVTLEALLAARLDTLPRGERAVAERASVEGQVFHVEAVETLARADGFDDVRASVHELVARDFFREADVDAAGKEICRFRHLLLRDTAYRAAPKRLRAEWHALLAGWLEELALDRMGEFEEIVGYHFEQAYRYLEQVGGVDERAHELRRRGAARLAAAGMRADARGDAAGAAATLERAAALLEPDPPDRARLLPELGQALYDVGRLSRASDVLTEAVRQAELCGDRGSAARARLVELRIRLQVDPLTPAEHVLEASRALVPEFERAGDDLGLARAWLLVGAASHLYLARSAEALDTLERARVHAARAGARRETTLALGRSCMAAARGSMPVPEAVRFCERALAQAGGQPDLEARACESLALLAAEQGRFEEARGLVRRTRTLRKELGQELAAVATAQVSGMIELLADAPAAAEVGLRAAFERFSQLGETGYLSTCAALLAEALLEQGLDDEAEDFTRRSQATAAEDDLYSQIPWRVIRSHLLAAQGREEEALGLAREAVELAARSDLGELQAEAEVALAHAAQALGDEQTARRAAEASVRLYEARGATVRAQRASRRLLGASSRSL
jgi:class 3 adenylate cyclase/tetratricopeptide (TPR) repeat protein